MEVEAEWCAMCGCILIPGEFTGDLCRTCADDIQEYGDGDVCEEEGEVN